MKKLPLLVSVVIAMLLTILAKAIPRFDTPACPEFAHLFYYTAGPYHICLNDLADPCNWEISKDNITCAGTQTVGAICAVTDKNSRPILNPTAFPSNSDEKEHTSRLLDKFKNYIANNDTSEDDSEDLLFFEKNVQ